MLQLKLEIAKVKEEPSKMTKTLYSYPLRKTKTRLKQKARDIELTFEERQGEYPGASMGLISLFFKINGRFAGIKFYYYIC